MCREPIIVLMIDITHSSSHPGPRTVGSVSGTNLSRSCVNVLALIITPLDLDIDHVF